MSINDMLQHVIEESAILMKRTLFRTYILLYVGIFIYSLAAVSNKVAATYSILSTQWIVYYVLGIAVMGIYAIIWQQVLKRISLITAYANKAVTTFLGIVWGAILFGESISLKIVMGAIIIVIGVILVTGAENER